MATFNTAFGALQTPQDVANRSMQPSLPGQQQMQAQMQSQQQQAKPAPQQTFAQMQQAGQARPAPMMAQAAQPQMMQRLGGALQQPAMAPTQMPIPAPPPQFPGSDQAQLMRQRIQQSLESFAQAPTRFDTAAFQQIRAAQQGLLGREFSAQQQALNEEMARRGLSASSIAAGRFGDLAGQQALAQAQIDAQLLQEAARTQAEDRANLLLQMSQLAELSGAQDLAQYQAQLSGQQQQFAQGIQQAGITGQYGAAPTLAGQELQLRLAELTGQAGGQQTLAAQRLGEEQRQFDIQQRLEEQLGLGGLTLEQQKFEQQTKDVAAERDLRQTMQTRELTAQEQQQLREIESRKEIESNRLAAQREQFYATLDAEESQFARSLDEQEALRLQNLGISETELGLRAQQIENEYEQRGKTIELDEARLEAEKDFRAEQLMREDRTLDLQAARDAASLQIDNARLQEETNARLARDGFTEEEIGLRRTQIQNEYVQRGLEITQRKTLADIEDKLQRDLQKDRLANELTMQGKDITSREGQADLDRKLQDKISERQDAFNRYKVVEDSKNFDKEIAAREAEAAARFELSKTDLILQIASLLGITGLEEAVQKLPKYDPNANKPVGPTPGEE